MTTFFEIGPLQLAVESPADFPWTEEVAVFRRDTLPEAAAPIVYTLVFTDVFQPIRGRILSQGSQMLVMEAEGKECRVHLLPATGEPFALTQRPDPLHNHILIDRRARNALKWDRNLLGLMALEHDCLERGAFLLHASYVIWDGSAILFSAPSGHGKSTQADLWARHAGAQIINGDRALVFRRDGQWFAGGFPVCGSSAYCLDRCAPLKAMVYLEKAPNNRVLPLSPLQAMRRFYSQAFVNRWRPDDCGTVSSMLIELSQSVPVLHFQCTKEADAVSCLKQYLYSQRSESR